MTRMVQWLVMGLVVLMCCGDSGQLAFAADTSTVEPATKQVESGAQQAGHGIEQTAKGVGNTVTEGAKVTGDRMQEAERAARPRLQRAWEDVKHGAEATGAGIQRFFQRLFGS